MLQVYIKNSSSMLHAPVCFKYEYGVVVVDMVVQMVLQTVVQMVVQMVKQIW